MPTFDGRARYAAEILSVLTQQSPDNCRRLGASESSFDGIDELLQVCAHWRRKDPATQEEQECCENVFDTLCAVLLHGGEKHQVRRARSVPLSLSLSLSLFFAACGVGGVDARTEQKSI